MLALAFFACTNEMNDDDMNEQGEPKELIRILALGDSLTLGYGSGEEGEGSEAGYRIHLRKLLVEQGYLVDFVGSQNNGPSDFGDNEHEGYNGYSVRQVTAIAGKAVDTYAPDIVLILAGTNDQIEFVPPTQPPAGAAADLEDLIELIKARNPKVQMVLGQLIPLEYNDEKIREYNGMLPDIVERQQNLGSRLQLVNHYVIGDDALSSDGIHPTIEGYEKMAEIWLPAILNAIEAE